MIEKRTPIPVFEAAARVSQHQKLGDAEWIHLEESLHRFLAEDVKADHDVPAFDRSPYDGFAVRACDTAGASGENPCHARWSITLEPGPYRIKSWVLFKPSEL